MSKYDKTLKEIEIGKLNLKYKEKVLRNEFKKEYKTYILVLDVLMILFLIFNVGAIILTNALVVKENPSITFTEANVEYAKTAGLKASPVQEAKITLDSLFFIIGNYTLIFGIYFLIRFFMSREWHLAILGVYAIYWFSLGSVDFSHDFGFWFGKLIS